MKQLEKKQQILFDFIDTLQKQYEKVIPAWGPLGYAVYKRTYARWIEEENRHEEFNETVARVLKGAVRLGTKYNKEELKRLFKYFFEMKCSFSGRELWQMETKLLLEGYCDSTINCHGLVIDELEAICYMFEELMLGGGVGFSVEQKYISKLPKVLSVNHIEQENIVHLLPIDSVQTKFKENGFFYNANSSNYYVVADTRQGWIELLRLLFQSYFVTGDSLYFDTALVRKKGELIRGFGGKASGPDPLIKAIFLIKEILDKASGRQLNSVEVLDICCIIGQCVVSGNVRRTALLALGDVDDINFITCKRWDLQTVPDYRPMVNISVNCNDIEKLPQEFWDSYEKLGECIGLVNIDNCKEYGRTGKNSFQDKLFYYEKQKGNEIAFEDLQTFHNKINSVKVDETVKIVNPCQHENTLVLTKDGLKRFKDVEIGSIIWSGKYWTKIINKVYTGKKDVYKYKTTAGFIEATPNHRIVQYGQKIEIDKAENIDICSFPKDYLKNDLLNSDDIMAGLVFGDGYTQHENQLLIIGEKDQDYFTSEINHLIFESYSKQNTFKVKTYVTTNQLSVHLPERYLDNSFLLENSTKLRGFLRGLYSANGSVTGNRITFKSTCFNLIEQIQIILHSLGIESYYTTNKSKEVEFSNGKYICKKSFDLNIGNYNSKCLFNKYIGFIQSYKNEKLQKIIDETVRIVENKRTFSINEIEHLGKLDVYDITVESEDHTYWNNGFLVSNCGEANLANRGQCCLAQIVLKNVKNYSELLDIGKLLYKQKKHITQGKYLNIETEKLINEQSRIGISITAIFDSKEKLKWLSSFYTELRQYDLEYSKKNNFPISFKLTVVQPDGTGSSLRGTSPGCNPNLFKFGNRTIRMADNDPLWKLYKKHGHLVENLKTRTNLNSFVEDPNTKVVYFPIKNKEDSLTIKDVSAIEHLEMVKLLQQEYVDQSVSVTVNYNIEELPEIKQWLKDNWKDMKTVSFLQYKDSSGFLQAPYQEITEEEYNIAVAKITPVVSMEGLIDLKDLVLIDEKECEGGASCPIR